MSLEYEAFLLANSMHRSNILSDIKLLWKSIAIDRADFLAIYLQKPSLKRAYLSYYWVLYAIKIARLLNNLKINFENPPKILDLGAGPLSATMGAALFYKNLSNIFAVDRDVNFMKIGLKSVEKLLNVKLDIEFIKANLKWFSSSWKPKLKIDLIFIAHVLNEFGNNYSSLEKKKKLILNAINCLSPNGVLLIIEPASKTISRDLMKIRDWIQDNEQAKIIAPCFSGILKCPLLVQSKFNWCHSEISYNRPTDMAKIDKLLGLEKDFLKFSYLAITPVDSNRKSSKLRIVSGAMNSRYSSKYYVCSQDGIKTLSGYRNDISNSFVDFRRGQEIDLSV